MHHHHFQNLLQSECHFTGKVIMRSKEVAEEAECFAASQLLHGSYYVHEDLTQTCVVYGSNERSCNVYRGPAGLGDCFAH